MTKDALKIKQSTDDILNKLLFSSFLTDLNDSEYQQYYGAIIIL